MGRPVRRSLVGTKRENLSNINETLTRIEGAEVYWGDNGTLAIVASPEWSAYLTGKSNVRPRDIREDGVALSEDDISLACAELFGRMEE